MTKRVLSFAASICFLTITLLAIPFFVFGQETTSPSIDENQKTTTSIIKYDLAYPGILPDHPLYKLKVLRDKISALLISDPQKKINFYLLQADKGILASAMLVDKGKFDLAEQTALKAEHNYTIISQTVYRLSPMPSEEFFDKLHNASLKHQEVLKSLINRVPNEKQNTFNTVIDFSKRNWGKVEEYKRTMEEESKETEKKELPQQ